MPAIGRRAAGMRVIREGRSKLRRQGAGFGGGGGGGGELADTLRFSNWPLYIDYDEKTKKHPTLDQFTPKNGVDVD